MDISICIITYNQEKYIARAIESAIMQQCNCLYEIVISDDCSTDNTRSIIEKFALQYPELIRPYFAASNIGMLKNWENALKLCKGKYIALLEGDDFWIDKLKLQKQYDILEANPDYVISFTNAYNQYEDGESGYGYYVDKTAEVYVTADLIAYNFIPTCSVLMRNHISDNFFPAAYFKSPFADWIIHLINSKFGKIHFLNEFTCTYQIHNQGVWSGIKKEKQLLNKLQALNCVNEIITDKGFLPSILASKREVYKDIYSYYRQQKQFINYFKYRLKLMFI